MKENPKFQARNSKQRKNPKSECPKPAGATQTFLNFDRCSFGFASDFEIRISDFPRRLAV